MFIFSDGNKPAGDSWVKMYRMASSFVQRDKGIFSPCFTYDNPNEYKVGKSNATVRIAIYFNTQCAKWILNKIAKAINETFAGLKLMLQGFRIYFFQNPSIKGMESTS